MISSKQTKPRTTGRAQERRALHAASHKEFAAIGSFVSTTPRVQLLGCLRKLKPQLNLQLHAIEPVAEGHRYQVEVETHDLQRRHLIDVWTGIKGALTSSFPEQKPGGVRSLQP